MKMMWLRAHDPLAGDMYTSPENAAASYFEPALPLYCALPLKYRYISYMALAKAALLPLSSLMLSALTVSISLVLLFVLIGMSARRG